MTPTRAAADLCDRYTSSTSRKGGTAVSQKIEFLYLSAEDVTAAGGADMGATMEACEEAFRLFEAGECRELPSGKIHWNGEHARRAGPKVAYVGGHVDAVGVKWIPANPDNPKDRNLPRAIAQIILTDPVSAVPRAIMDGTIISAVRTAAVGGLFAKHLARPGAETLSVIGTGPIGRNQLNAILMAVPSIRRVSVYDLTPERSRQFVADKQAEFPRVEFDVAGSARECIEAGDVIATATVTAPEDAYIEYDWLRPGALVINTSSNDTKMETFRRAPRLVFSYSREKPGNRLRTDAARCYEEGILPSDKLVHISEVITGKQAVRRDPDDIVVSLPMGMAIMDVINAQRVYEAALQRGIGRTLPLWENTPWV